MRKQYKYWAKVCLSVMLSTSMVFSSLAAGAAGTDFDSGTTWEEGSREAGGENSGNSENSGEETESSGSKADGQEGEAEDAGSKTAEAGEKEPGNETEGEETGEKDPGSETEGEEAGEKDPGSETEGEEAGEKEPGSETEGEETGEKDSVNETEGEETGEKDPVNETEGEETGEKDPGSETEGEESGEKEPGNETEGEETGEKDPGNETEGEETGEKTPGNEADGETPEPGKTETGISAGGASAALNPDTAVPAETELEEQLLETWNASYLGEEVLLNDGDILTELDFSSSADPAQIVKKAFDKASKYSSDGNIEGPQGKNCAVASASDWKGNGNLSVVDLASASDAEKAWEYDGAETNAASILRDTHVFRYYLHGEKDYDRNTSITDRQRIELKTESNNPDINSVCGDILTAKWKFFLPEDTPLPYNPDPLGDTNNFFHIFQTKATQGDESSMPVFTFTVNDEELVFEASDCGHVNEDLQHIDSVDIHRVLGRWMEAEVITYTAEKGYVYVSLKDISNPLNPETLMDTGYSVDNWRRPEREEHREGSDRHYYEYDAPAIKNQNNRSKWGLYRKIFDKESGFDEAVMYLGDLQIIKHDPDGFVFPDGFDPSEQSRDISWAVKCDPVMVLEGTDPSNIYLPSQAEVYVNANDPELVDVEWDWASSNYDQAVKGTYTVYGILVPEEGLENPDDVHAQIEVCVTDNLSQKRVNWAIGTEFGGAASVKTVGGSESNPSSNLIDGSEETIWSTHSGLIKQNEEDNGGYRYWAAVDLGAVRSFDEIYYALGSIGSSKQFRLHNYAMYYTNTDAAYEELIGGTTGNPREKGVTPNPLETVHGGAWEPIEGVYKENIISEGKKEVTNNIQHHYDLDEAVEARYVLVLGEIETVDATSGAIQTKVLKLIGNMDEAAIPHILGIKAPETISVEPGRDFDSLGLPAQVEAVLSDGTTEPVFVSWNPADYRNDAEGMYKITGQLSFADSKMQNPELLEAAAYVEVRKTVDSTTVDWTRQDGVTVKTVSWMNDNPSGYLIDGDPSTLWKTDSRLVKSGFRYWAAVDLGAERNVDQLDIFWENTGNRLKNYQFYYASDTPEAENAYGKLREGENSMKLEGENLNSVTGNPMEESDVWKPIEGASLATKVEKNTEQHYSLKDPVAGRYILLLAELDADQSAGAVCAKELTVSGTQGGETDTLEITAMEEPEACTVAYGTPFGKIRLPESIHVTLENEETAEVFVEWQAEGYSRTATGSVWIKGNLILPESLENSKGLQAQLQINIEGSEIARTASVIFMEAAGKEFARYDSVIVGSKITAPANPPEKEGYVFAGWCLDAEGTVHWNREQDRLTASGMILYASWEKKPEKPADPEDPTNPTDPTNPEDPKDPADPTDPENPTQPQTPAKPMRPSTGGSGGGGSHTNGSDAADGRTDGRWKQDQTGWWYQLPDGSYPAGRWEKIFWNGAGRWFYFGNDGYMKTGWLTDTDGRIYYLNPVSDGNQGVMLSGWQMIDEAWYYFNSISNGYMGMLMESRQKGDEPQ